MILKCDWDCCKHNNTETGHCDNPDEVVLVTEEVATVNKDGIATGGKMELFTCQSFESYEESEAKQV